MKTNSLDTFREFVKGPIGGLWVAIGLAAAASQLDKQGIPPKQNATVIKEEVPASLHAAPTNVIYKAQ